MSDEDKQSLENQKLEDEEEYKVNILEFVGDLAKDDRKTYLGFNRKKLALRFNKDIFAEKYPNTKYPVYEYTASSSPKKTNVLPKGITFPSVASSSSKSGTSTNQAGGSNEDEKDSGSRSSSESEDEEESDGSSDSESEDGDDMKSSGE